MGFAKGNPGGPGGARAGAGRRPRSDRLELRALLDRAVSDRDWVAVLAKLLEVAKAGDVAAVRALLDRRFGKVEPVAVVLDREARLLLEGAGFGSATWDVSRLTDEELDVIIALGRKAEGRAALAAGEVDRG